MSFRGFSGPGRIANCKAVAIRHRTSVLPSPNSQHGPWHGRCYLVANKGNHTMRIVQIKRDMDAAAMAEMKPMFEELADGAESVCFDLGSVGFLDSSGVGGIVFVFKRLQKRSLQVTLANVEGQPLRLLRQLRLEFMLERRPTRAA
jgi:anti-sigma B factor antagonist